MQNYPTAPDFPVMCTKEKYIVYLINDISMTTIKEAELLHML